MITPLLQIMSLFFCVGRISAAQSIITVTQNYSPSSTNHATDVVTVTKNGDISSESAITITLSQSNTNELIETITSTLIRTKVFTLSDQSKITLTKSKVKTMTLTIPLHKCAKTVTQTNQVQICSELTQSESGSATTMTVTKEVDKTNFVTVTAQPSSQVITLTTQGITKLITITPSKHHHHHHSKTKKHPQITVVTITQSDFTSAISLTLQPTTSVTGSSIAETTITQVEMKTVNTDILYITLTSNQTKEETITKTDTYFVYNLQWSSQTSSASCTTIYTLPTGSLTKSDHTRSSSIGQISLFSSLSSQKQSASSTASASTSQSTTGTSSQSTQTFPRKSVTQGSSQTLTSPRLDVSAVTSGGEIWFKVITMTSSSQSQMSSSKSQTTSSQSQMTSTQFSLASSTVDGVSSTSSEASIIPSLPELATIFQSTIPVQELSSRLYSLCSNLSTLNNTVTKTKISISTLTTTQSLQKSQSTTKTSSLSKSQTNAVSQSSESTIFTTTLQGQVTSLGQTSSLSPGQTSRITYSTTIVSPMQSSKFCSVVMTMTLTNTPPSPLTPTSKSFSSIIFDTTSFASPSSSLNPLTSTQATIVNFKACEECRRNCDPNLPANECCMEECGLAANVTQYSVNACASQAINDIHPCGPGPTGVGEFSQDRNGASYQVNNNNNGCNLSNNNVGGVWYYYNRPRNMGYY